MDAYVMKLSAANRLNLRREDIDFDKLTNFQFRASCGVPMSSFAIKYYDSVGDLSKIAVAESLASVKRHWEYYLISLITI